MVLSRSPISDDSSRYHNNAPKAAHYQEPYEQTTILPGIPIRDIIEFRFLKPRSRGVNRSHDVPRWLRYGHEELHNLRALSAALARHLIVARRTRFQRQRIMLLAPNCSPPIHNDLGRENALNTAIHTFPPPVRALCSGTKLNSPPPAATSRKSSSTCTIALSL